MARLFETVKTIMRGQTPQGSRYTPPVADPFAAQQATILEKLSEVLDIQAAVPALIDNAMRQVRAELRAVEIKLDGFYSSVESSSRQLRDQMESIMTTLQEDVDKMATLTTTVDGLAVFVQGMIDKINAIPGLTPEQQAAIDAIGASADHNLAAVDAAIHMNVTPTPPPTEVPPVEEPPPA